ncbi:Fic family protein [Sphingomonas sp. LY54]|uniref:Fic family protein n=1 Tax=Sphingomonas sp. LY54 TaxID=3095343 RepID=UPI002D76F870|nr:Fic family protein [Sphingomonas sp. LY54]WRP27212.1 Fic family protein [Sphingomonas sp. LY54]
MLIFEIVGTENHAAYQELTIANLDRQYNLLRSLVIASMSVNRPLLSAEVLKSLNYHAITCLHGSAGQWRPCKVTVGDYVPPAFHQVPGLMHMFIDEVNRFWEQADAVYLATWVLWRLNHIHPFVNGNGRTARAVCYFVLCLKLGGWMDSDVLLPELLRAHRDEYVAALKHADATFASGGLDLGPLHALVTRLLQESLRNGGDEAPVA